ncbi:MAG: GNAT family N-acetyltransferase [Planctomycetota bacterium]|jgi:RimJ/RimL family protein N-acetyltransferase
MYDEFVTSGNKQNSPFDFLDSVDLGYRFFSEYWGRGLATEAGLASVRFGFEVLSLERIIGLVMPDNTASIRVLEKVGMRFECEVEDEGDWVYRYAIER